MRLRKVIRRLLGETVYSKLRAYRRRRAEHQFVTRQGVVQLQVGDFILDAPSKHILVRLQSLQPYRDLAVGIVARELARKYPGETFVDIGANIGDTAAIMATYAPNPKILVEPSYFYCNFLRRNAARIPSVAQIHQVLISSRERETGMLVHGDGTARFETGALTNTWECKQLAKIADESTRFIKIDTDGFDVPILAASLDFLTQRQPCLFYENAVPTQEALDASNRLLGDLAEAGYRYFAVFDDAGLHLVSTSDLSLLQDLNRYLFKSLTGPRARDLYNWDVLCLPAADEDVFVAVTDYYRQY
jgi:FkbM family methyltransferase